MLQIKLQEVMRARGVKPTPAFLRAAGFSERKAKYLLYENPRKIKLDDLEKLCMLLHCTPYEIIKLEHNKKFPTDHPLFQWIAPPDNLNPSDYLRILPPEKLKEAAEALKRLLEEGQEGK
jgi:DNA-binding Xre family transcriptional regulator